jgi:hypothetical protein
VPEFRIDDLNPEQLRAATAGEGPVLTIAGAGTGKTKTLASRGGLARVAGDRSASGVFKTTAAEMAGLMPVSWSMSSISLGAVAQPLRLF